jgi:hypothetical protein
MRRTELAARAKLVILPAGTGPGEPCPAGHAGTVRDAVRHVLEVLPPEERPRAVIQTPTRLLFFSEIEAIFEIVVLREGRSAQDACAAAG